MTAAPARTPELAARRWAHERGIHGRKGSTYLYYDDVVGYDGDKPLVKERLYLPIFSGRKAIQGYRHLAILLEGRAGADDGFRMVEVDGGYEVQR